MKAKLTEEEKEILDSFEKGDSSSICRKKFARRSPFDVSGLDKNISRKEILDAIHESRKRA